ncbi:hypothetical protein MMC07_000423 [Pseudocyphellaria aurata]|nr:hypothetical protein [Pseudocyphellaria aurata]
MLSQKQSYTCSPPLQNHFGMLQYIALAYAWNLHFTRSSAKHHSKRLALTFAGSCKHVRTDGLEGRNRSTCSQKLQRCCRAQLLCSCLYTQLELLAYLKCPVMLLKQALDTSSTAQNLISISSSSKALGHQLPALRYIDTSASCWQLININRQSFATQSITGMQVINAVHSCARQDCGQFLAYQQQPILKDNERVGHAALQYTAFAYLQSFHIDCSTPFRQGQDDAALAQVCWQLQQTDQSELKRDGSTAHAHASPEDAAEHNSSAAPFGISLRELPADLTTHLWCLHRFLSKLLTAVSTAQSWSLFGIGVNLKRFERSWKLRWSVIGRALLRGRGLVRPLLSLGLAQACWQDV